MSHEEIDVYELENFFRTAEVKLADESEDFFIHRYDWMDEDSIDEDSIETEDLKKDISMAVSLGSAINHKLKNKEDSKYKIISMERAQKIRETYSSAIESAFSGISKILIKEEGDDDYRAQNHRVPLFHYMVTPALHNESRYKTFQKYLKRKGIDLELRRIKQLVTAKIGNGRKDIKKKCNLKNGSKSHYITPGLSRDSVTKIVDARFRNRLSTSSDSSSSIHKSSVSLKRKRNPSVLPEETEIISSRPRLNDFDIIAGKKPKVQIVDRNGNQVGMCFAFARPNQVHFYYGIVVDLCVKDTNIPIYLPLPSTQSHDVDSSCISKETILLNEEQKNRFVFIPKENIIDVDLILNQPFTFIPSGKCQPICILHQNEQRLAKGVVLLRPGSRKLYKILLIEAISPNDSVLSIVNEEDSTDAQRKLEDIMFQEILVSPDFVKEILID